MCECKKDLEEKLVDRFKQKHPEATEHHAELTGYAIGIDGNSMFLVGVMPIALTANYPMKKGTAYKQKTTKQMMHFNFCPFCGEKYEKGGAGETAEVQP